MTTDATHATDASTTPPEADGHPLLTIEDTVATLRLCRPSQHNRIDPTDLAVLMQHFDTIDRTSALRVLIVTGTGSRTFSSGYTLQAVNTLSANGVTFGQVVDRLENLSIPTVCALNGSVYGGATDIALACDFRIGVTGSRLVMPATRIGLHYYAGGMRRYVERLGLDTAKRLFLLGEPVDAVTLERLGYLHALVDPSEFAARVAAMAQTLASAAPTVARSMKKHLNAIARGHFDEAGIQDANARSMRSADLREGLAALAEKRPPRFTGE